MKNNVKIVREVVVVLPYIGRSVLLQLRDSNPDIVFPGLWGFFGGSVEPGEKPKETAFRELFEELNYKPKAIYKLGTEVVPEIGLILSHSYFCSLTTSLDRLILKEGQDFGLFTIAELESRQLYSKKLKKYSPLVPTQYIARCVRKLLNRIDHRKHVYP